MPSPLEIREDRLKVWFGVMNEHVCSPPRYVLSSHKGL